MTQGRSPRVRGSQVHRLHQRVGAGSIPACAGEPTASFRRRPFARVDPRVCGGASVSAPEEGSTPGRSPRVRGSRAHRGAAVVRIGSIPACAGEPAGASGGRAEDGVDPRVCGGAMARARTDSPAAGRSPRVRGSQDDLLRDPRVVGSIPACAGEPSTARASARSGWVDPRVCGGATGWYGSATPPWGRSPRVRGSRPLRHVATRCVGSIPACAGEPRRPCCSW